MYDLSICLAAIRKENWNRLYKSIVDSIGDYTFELIFCGPHKDPPEELKDLDNVSCIQDWGAPTRAQQISMKDATGRYIAWTADDGWFLPNKLADCIRELDEDPTEKKCLVTQYIEGGVNALGTLDDDRCYMNFHDPIRSPFYPDYFLIFNSVILPTQYFKDLGGFDCRFEACPMAFVDFGARAQLDGIKTTYKGVIFECTQFPGEQGDHAPIHNGQIEHDQPLYEQLWNPDRTDRNPKIRIPLYPIGESAFGALKIQKTWAQAQAFIAARIKIDYDNWKDVPAVWKRRFSNPWPDAPKEENK